MILIAALQFRNTMDSYLPTFEELSKVFIYNKNTGIFTRKIKTAACTNIGDIAGHINSQGYNIIKYNSKAYKAHRLAWLFIYRVWPIGIIDHIDRNKSNNAINNLRDVNSSINTLNTSTISKNKSGYKGVTLHNGNKWRARIMIKGIQTIIGTYDTPEEASIKYNSFKASL